MKNLETPGPKPGELAGMGLCNGALGTFSPGHLIESFRFEDEDDYE